MRHTGGCHVDPRMVRVSDDERRSAEIQQLALAGLGCPNCANRVRNALLTAPGVVDVEVDLSSALATVWYRRERTGVPNLVDAVAGAGRGTHHRYLAVPVTPGAAPI